MYKKIFLKVPGFVSARFISASLFMTDTNAGTLFVVIKAKSSASLSRTLEKKFWKGNIISPKTLNRIIYDGIRKRSDMDAASSIEAVLPARIKRT